MKNKIIGGLAVMVFVGVASAQNISIRTMDGGGTWIGVSVNEVTSENLSALKLKEERGVEVVTVMSDSPAQKAGIKEHDVILEYNGTRIEGVDQFRRLISETPAGRTAKLVVSRGGVPLTISATVEARPHSSFFQGGDGDFMVAPRAPIMRVPRAAPPAPTAPPATFPPPNARRFFFDGDLFGMTPRMGIEGEAIGSQLGEFFGVPDKEGVLVRSVASGSAADKAGIKVGDVVIKSGGTRVRDMSDLRDSLRDNAGKTFPVVLIRNKKETTVNVKIDKPESFGGEHVFEQLQRELGQVVSLGPVI